MRTFNGGAGMHGGLSLEVTSDGGFIGTGQHGNAAGICDLYAYKVDGCGNPEWYNLFPCPSNAGGRCVKQTADGGYIIAGLSTYGAGAYDIWLMKLDAGGNLVWNKTYGLVGEDYGLYVNFTSDGGYIVTGFVSGVISTGQNIVLIKTDASGNMQWSKVYGGTGNDWGDYVAQTADGGYVVVGYTTSFGAGGPDVYILKTDATGNLLWTKTYGTPDDDSPPWGTLARIAPDGGIVVCSHTNHAGFTAGGFDMWVFKTDSLGNVLWSNAYGGAGTESARYIEPTQDNGWVVCGYTDSWGAGLDDGYLIKIDQGGALQWSKTYGSDSIEYAECVKATKDGGYSVSMYTFGFGATYVDPVFLKTDGNGNVGCHDYTAGTIVTPFMPTIASGGQIAVPALVITSPTVTMGTYTPVDTYLCFQCAFLPEFVPQDTLGCPGSPVNFYNTTNHALRCAENWQVNGNNTTGGVDTLTYTFATPGYYTVSLIGQCGHNTDTMNATVHIIPEPVPEFYCHNRCLDTAIVFTDSSSAYISTQLVQRKWYFGDGDSLVSVVVTNPVHQYLLPGTYQVTLVVTDQVGCTSSITKAVVVYPVPQAAFSYNDECNFNAVQFSDSSTISQGNIVTYRWSFGDGSLSAQQSPSHLYPGVNQYQASLAVVSDSGCLSTTESHTVSIFAVPVAGFSVVNSCFGITSQFTDTSKIGAGSIATYNWDFGDSTTSQSISPSHLYAHSGTFNVKLVISSDHNCTDSVLRQVIIYPRPLPDFSITDTCAGLTFSFSNLSTVSSGNMVSQVWSFGDGGTSAQVAPSHLYPQPGNFNVHLIAYTDHQCVDSVTLPLIVYPNPVSAFTYANVCNGYVNSFTNTSSVITGSVSLSEWSLGDGTDTSVTNPAYTYANAGSYTVQLIAVSDKGCADTVKHQIQVYVQPEAAFVASSPCIGNAMQFTDSSSPAGQPNTWNWSFGDGVLSAIQNPSHLYASAGSYNVQLIVTTANSCSDTAALTVVVRGKGAAQFGSVNVCLNDSTPFTNTTTGTGNYPDSTWLWNFGDGAGSSVQMSPDYRYVAAGTYNVTLAALFTDGCADTISNPVVVYVLPTVDSVVKEVSCYGEADGDILLTPVNGQIPFTYLWSNAGAGNHNSLLSLGNYTVTFTDAHQCTASAAFAITQPPLLTADTVVRPIICFGADNGSIIVTPTGGTPPYSFIWSNGDNSSGVTNLAPNTYTVTVSDAHNCSVLKSASLVQPPLYQISIDSDFTINLGETLQLNPVAVNGNAVSWEWTPSEYLSCYNCQSPVAAPFVTITYNVETVSDQGCDASKSVQVNVIPVYNVFVPNSFTPNNDGNNDYFEVFGNKSAWKQFSIQIFDRLGELVFESSDMNFKWDGQYKGKPLPMGVLVYEMYVVYMDNHTDKVYKGSLTLLR